MRLVLDYCLPWHIHKDCRAGEEGGGAYVAIIEVSHHVLSGPWPASAE